MSQTAELSLDEIMNYELSPYPQAHFEAKHVLQKADRAQLMQALKSHVTATSNEAILETAPEAEHNVLDGGSLLRQLKWSDGRTYISNTNDYATFTVKHYGKATVVFDGYSGGPGTKDSTHLRRRPNRDGHKVNITETTKFTGKVEDFISNNESKQTMIHMTADCIKIRGCHVIHAMGDADLDIVRTAISVSSEKTTMLIGASPSDGKKLR